MLDDFDFEEIHTALNEPDKLPDFMRLPLRGLEIIQEELRNVSFDSPGTHTHKNNKTNEQQNLYR